MSMPAHSPRTDHVLNAFASGAVIAKNGEFMYAVDLITSPVVVENETTWDKVDYVYYQEATRH